VSRFRPLAGSFALLCLIAESSPAAAWGPEGHAIVAEIAEARLAPAAREAVRRLLAADTPTPHTHLDEVASWPDAWRANHPETTNWHFVDIPLAASGFVADRDCAGSGCIVARLPAFAAILGDRHAAIADRVAALKFVVHFVGDIHQPLHCASQRDHGGNDVRLAWQGAPSNLHAVWDGGIIEAALETKLGPNYAPDLAATRPEAERLLDRLSPGDAESWAPRRTSRRLGTVATEWAEESHVLAAEAYDDLPRPQPEGWETAYRESEWPAVQRQLTLAGIRLAALLNDSLH
jgi:hypothetical protein